LGQRRRRDHEKQHQGERTAERYFAEKGMDRSASLPLTQHVVDSAFVINHESKAIADLWQRFGSIFRS
jgi:hypothetical protein